MGLSESSTENRSPKIICRMANIKPGGRVTARSAARQDFFCMPFHRVILITEGVSATANEESEEEKLRKLCGYSVNAAKLQD